MRLRGAVGYVACALFSGLLMLALTVGARDSGVGLTGGVLALAAAAGLLGLGRLAGRSFVWRLDWGKVGVGAVVTIAAVAGTLLAMERIGASLTAVVLATIPVFVAFGAQMSGRKRLNGPLAAGLGLGILGLFLVAVAPIGEPSWRFIDGVLFGVGTAVVVGASGRWLGTRVKHERAVEHGVASLLLAAAALFCVAPFTPGTGGPGCLAVIAALGLGCGLVLLVAMSQAADDVSRLAAATLPGVGMVLAALGGVLLLGEQVSPVEWFGALLVLAGTSLLSEPLASLLPASWRG